MKFHTIDIERDKNILIKFRKDTFSISSGTEKGFDEIAYIDRMTERVNNFPDGQLIIEEDNLPIGQIGLLIQNYYGTKIGYVNLFYLIPDYRNRGLGKQLIDYTENFFKKLKVNEFHLRVSPKNERAVRFYIKSGMMKLKEEKKEHIVWRMRKTL